MIVKLLTERCLEFLSLKGGCRGWSESTLVKMFEISCHSSFIFADYGTSDPSSLNSDFLLETPVVTCFLKEVWTQDRTDKSSCLMTLMVFLKGFFLTFTFLKKIYSQQKSMQNNPVCNELWVG